jgi:acyl-CoA synthetase (AMP-forming)/AMP-acid ligase II
LNKYLQSIIHNFYNKPNKTFCYLIRNGVDIPITWNRLHHTSAEYTSIYKSFNIKQSSIVLIFLPHSEHLYGVFLGAMFGGLVPSFMPCISRKQNKLVFWKSHQELFEKIKPAAVVTNKETLDEMRLNSINLEDIYTIVIDDVTISDKEYGKNFTYPLDTQIALLQHSSGTTGLKKGVMLSYEAIVRQVESYAQSIKLSKDDLIISWLPLYHDMGFITCFISPLYFSTTFVHLDPFEWVGQPELIFKYISKYSGTRCWLPNFSFDHLSQVCQDVAQKYDLSSIRSLINCSEFCSPSTFDRFLDNFQVAGIKMESLQCCYAMAESVFAVTQTQIGKVPKRVLVRSSSLKLGAKVEVMDNFDDQDSRSLIEVGKPVAGVDLLIVNDKKCNLDNAVVGEIAIKAEFLFSGYNNLPELTAKKLVNGVYYSGDLGFIYNNSLYVLGRIDDLIIINGRNIYATEIEQCVSVVENIRDGRVVALGKFYEAVGSMRLYIVIESDVTDLDKILKIKKSAKEVVHSTFNVIPANIYVTSKRWVIKTTSGKISREKNLIQLDDLIREGE